MTGYRLDPSYRRPNRGSTILAGSPLRIFRLSTAGVGIAELIEGNQGLPAGHQRLTDRLVDAGAIHPIATPVNAVSAESVTLVVPTWNRDVTITHRGPIIVVDDASTVPCSFPSGCTVIRHDINRGPGAARMTGLAAVTTPYVAFIDADVSVTADWLQSLLGHFDDPRCALVAPRVRSAELQSNSLLDRYEVLRSPLDLGLQPARIAAGTAVSYVPAAAMVCRVDAIRQVDGFDSSMRFGEDVDLVWRLEQLGWRCRYEPSSVVTHQPRPSWKAWAVQRVSYGSSAAPLARRHPSSVAPAHVSGWSLLIWTMIASSHPLAAAVIAGANAIGLRRKLPDLSTETTLLVVNGHRFAGLQLANAIRRVWLPVALVGCLFSRRARLITATAFAATLLDRRGTPPAGSIDPCSYLAIRVADDACYCAGVWTGAVTERSIAALVPRVSGWPGRST